MKVILIQNVPNFGQKDEVKNVSDGYWRNFLLPQKLAVEATSAALAQVQKRKEKIAEEKEYKEKQLAKMLENLKEETLVIERKADKTGTLFDGLDIKELMQLIKERLRIEIPEELIKLEKPIKKIGSHEIQIGDSILKTEIKPE
ncbi:50S ribosomal protein L9 [Patescibacteria group bacterium]|nr:50S ribosomal protein L9 [Patescibacteria group bacterium]